MAEILRYAGFAQETEYNPTGIAPEADYYVDIASATLDTPSDTQIVYGGGLGRTPFLHRPGFYAPAGNIVYAFDIRTIGFLLKWALGGYAFTGEHEEGEYLIQDNDTVAAEVDIGPGDRDGFTIADGEFKFVPKAGDKIKVSGFSAGGNNGTFTVAEGTDATSIIVEETLSAEAAENDISIRAWHNLHEVYGANNVLLDTFTARLGKDVFEHVFQGCVLNTLTLAIEGEYCMATADIIAGKDSKAAIKPVPELVLPRQYPLVFHEATATIAGVDESCQIKSMTLAINNNASAENGRGIGQRFPCRIPVGSREVTLTKSLWYEDTKHLERYWGGASGPSATGSEEIAVDLKFDSGDFGELTLSLPRFINTQVQQQPSGRDELVQEVAGTAMQAQEVELEDESVVGTEILAVIENGEGSLE